MFHMRMGKKGASKRNRYVWIGRRLLHPALVLLSTAAAVCVSECVEQDSCRLVKVCTAQHSQAASSPRTSRPLSLSL